MDYKIINHKDIFQTFDMNNLPSNIDMYYDLSYQLSTYIFDYRKKLNLSQTELAEKLNVKQAMVSKLESGNYNISLENLCNVMAKIDTKVELRFKTFQKAVQSYECKNDAENKNNVLNDQDLKKWVGAA